MEVKVTVGDYFSKEELRDIVEDEVRCYVVSMVRDYFKHNSYRDFVEGVARDAYWDDVDQLGEDTLGKVRRQVRKLIGTLDFQSHRPQLCQRQRCSDPPPAGHRRGVGEDAPRDTRENPRGVPEGYRF